MKKTVLAAGVLAAFCAAAIDDAAIEELIAKMTLEEKVGQLVQCASSGKSGVKCAVDSSGAVLHADCVEWVRKGQIGSFLGACGIKRYNAIQKIAVEEGRLGIPIMVGHDMIRGVRTQLPIPLGFAATWNEDIWYKAGELIARETPTKGCDWTFTPMIDTARDPRWGRIAEGGGQDPLLTGRMGAAMVKGIQTPGLSRRIAACLKHYVGYGAPIAGREYNAVDMSESMLRNFYLPAFKMGIDAGAATVMPAFHSFNGVPCTGSKWLLKDILRDELGFKGMTISDYDAVIELVKHGFAADRYDATVKAINAGLDQDMMSWSYAESLADAVKAGDVSMETLDEAVWHVLQLKNWLGLFEHPYIDEQALAAQNDYEAHAQFAREVAAKSSVLLKNANKALPLKKGAKVALIGPGGDDRKQSNGCWAHSADNAKNMTIVDGLKADGVDFTYTRGYDYESDYFDAEGIHKAAAEADIIVALFGEYTPHSGEAFSRMKLELAARQLEALDLMKSTERPIVAVVMSGRPLAIKDLDDKADAVLEVWAPGTSGGWGVADVLTGLVNPQGRLTCEFPYSSGQCPVFYNRTNTGKPALKFEYCTSSFMDGPTGALYPFGYGLSYTTYEYANESVEVGNGKLVFSADVTNTGDVEGVETVQVYTREMTGVEVRPIRELREWKQVALKPGETKHVAIEVPFERLSYYAGSKLVKASGKMKGWICRDSVSGRELDFALERGVRDQIP